MRYDRSWPITEVRERPLLWRIDTWNGSIADLVLVQRVSTSFFVLSTSNAALDRRTFELRTPREAHELVNSGRSTAAFDPVAAIGFSRKL